MSDLYERIETLCKEKGVNITAMCKESGASRGSLTDLKKGRIQALSSDTLAKIADYFCVPVDFFLGKENAPAAGGGRTIRKEDVMFALSRGREGTITEEMYQEILSFTDYVMEREARKKENA